MATVVSATIITPSLLLIPPPNSLTFSISKPYSQSLTPLLRLSKTHEKFPPKIPEIWRISAAAEDSLPPSPPIENAQQIVPAAAAEGGDNVSTIVSALLFAAFVGLSLLTIGVIYLAVQDFLQKREREKFEKEEATKKKKGGKKTKLRAKTGPRGFGQKIDEDDDD